ncbi:hypothetical protein SPRG_21042 [Saprolegnia parasitica CBS 223.65]|uniref:Dynein heavy chain linker domain-containing protein n=1 Tax=Saprolegnia parasitica (strain CBS 223.65) TaxID=695850 RepID=A0A067BXT8_SAPPC|nr:hypothetical protein SPRG_21042 [Saprolegnia parasitica CBS 223.65]KDO23339.1 hypothetical protein SPRG_21042 [Saprolegnia parasitica CBS 223.65]|eukprot:XP_012206007.1 hypothetical protein SPRG_21042 [Saprolegnia parasitica CBS 223.65]
MPRRRGPSHPDVLALAARASSGADAPLKDQLLRRVASSSVVMPSRQPSQRHDEKPHGRSSNHVPGNLDIIDSADKLLAYTLHVIDSRGRVEPRAICIHGWDSVFAPRRKPIEVLYLTYNPHPPCHFRNVYWLTRSPKDVDLRDEYFTLTSYGLTRVLGLESELFDLEAWLREKAIFDKIAHMQCIHQMRKMTVFHTWKHNTIGLRIAQAKKQLGDALLACDPIAGPFLLTVQRLVLDMIHALSSDLVPRGNPQPVQALSEHRVPTDATCAQIASTVQYIQGLLLDALHRLRAGPNADVTTVRFGRLLANADVLPVLIRTVDLMLLGAYFTGIMTALERLNVSVTGSTLSALEARGASTVGVAGSSGGSRDRYLHMDQLLKLPTEHSGSIAYKRLFHLHGDALPDPLFFVEMTVAEDVIISPPKDVTVRHLYEAVAFAITRVDTFPRHLLPASATLRNHSIVERIMKGLRSATDIYYVEMEELAGASRLVHIEFGRLQDQLAVTTRDDAELESIVQNAMAETATSDDLVAFVEDLEMALQFQADLRMVDSLLQIGPFLVNRSAFIGSSLDACSAMLRRLFRLAPDRCNRYYQTSHAVHVGHTKLLSSIPDSLAESVAWLDAFLLLRTELPDDARADDHPATRLEALLHASDATCDDISYETKCDLSNGASPQSHCTSRIEANMSFYMEILTRTITVRQDALYSEFQMLWRMLEIEWRAIEAEDAATDVVVHGFYGRAKTVPDLMSQAKRLLHTDAELRRFVGLLEHFNPLHAGLCQRPNKAAKQHNWLQGLLVLHDNIQRLIELKTRYANEPLSALDMAALAHTMEAISWQTYPLATVLGPSQPLLLRFQRHFAALELARSTADHMLAFKPDSWLAIALTPDSCTLSQLDEWLTTPVRKAELDAVCSESAMQLSVHATWRAVSDQLRRLTLTLTPMHRLIFLTNVHDLIDACEDAQLSLLTIQHRGNSGLGELQTTQASLARALDILCNLDRLQEAWHATGVLVDLPEARKVCDATFHDALRTLDGMSTQWRDRVMELSHTLELQNQGPALEKLGAAFDGFDFDASIAACDALTAAITATYDSMRSEVPRLCFLSDADLWALVTRKASPDTVRDVIVRCFNGVADVDVVAETATVDLDDAVTSHSFTRWMLAGHAVTLLKAVVFLDGIRLQLPEPFRVVGGLVFWLSRLDTDLRRAMLTLLGEAQSIITYDASIAALCEWLSTYSLPVALTFLHKSFCTALRSVLHSKSSVAATKVQLATTASTHAAHFLRLVASLRHPRDPKTVLRLEAVVLLLKYELETLDTMTHVASTREWADVARAYDRTLRFESPRANESSHLVAAMGHITTACDVHIDVHAPLLFLTPPTARCTYALLHVLQLNVCVVPFALRGSGKRTLLRSLGSFLMRYFVCVHATEATPHRVLKHWLAGVDALRAWVCVTDVFALPLSVLRAFFADILQLQHARFGQTIRWRHDDASGALFLPAHALTPPTHLVGPWLGQPLRPLAVVSHDRRLVLQSLLFMKGFSEPMYMELDGFLTTLALLEPNAPRYFSVSLYQRVTTLASAIVKSVRYVLKAAGHAVSHLTYNPSPLNIARYKDTNVLRFALLLVLSPLVDAGHLHSALDRFFPSTMELGQEYRMFEAAVRVVLEKASLIATPPLVTKAVALYNQFQMRAPVLLVGPAGAGKSTLLKACLQAQQLMRWTLCPQSDPSAHLAKRINLVFLGMHELELMALHSHLRRQGSTNAILHTFCQRPPIASTETMSCVVFDGPLPRLSSALESLVSLLSGDTRLYVPPPLPPQHRVATFDCMVLETSTLTDASPTIVTSCNILSLDDTVIPWTSLVDAWLVRQSSALPPAVIAIVKPMVLHSLGACMLPHLELAPLSVSIPQLVGNGLKLLTATFGSLVHDGASTWPLSSTMTGQLVFLLVLWGVGAHLTSERRRDLQVFALGAAKVPPVVVDAEGLLHKFPQLPHWTQPTLFEIVFNARDHTFGLTSACQETTVAHMSAVMVPTAQVRFAYGVFRILQKTAASSSSMLILGGRGAGKSTLLAALPRLVRSHKTQVWSRVGTERRYVSLLQNLLHHQEQAQWVFLDDVDLYGPSLELLRCALSHKRLFDAVRNQWTRLNVAICGTLSLAHDASLSLAEQRCMRPYFLLRLSDPHATELAAIHSAIVQERIGRPLSPSEHSIVSTTVTTALSLSSQPGILLLSPYITADVVRRTLIGEVPHEAPTYARWFVELQTAFYSAFVSERDRTDWRQHFMADIPPHTTLPDFDSDASFVPLLRALPLPTAVLKAAAEPAFYALRAHLLSQLKPTDVDLEWTARLSPPLVWHYVQLCHALEARHHVLCVGSRELVAAYVPLLSHVVRTCGRPQPIVLSYLTSHEDVLAHLASLLLATGIHEEDRVLCATEADWMQWPSVASFIQDVLDGNHSQLARSVVLQHVVATSLSSSSHVDILDAFMQRVQRHLTLLLWGSSASLAPLLTRARASVRVIALRPPHRHETDLLLAAKGTMTHLRDAHPDLGLSLSDCDHLATISVQVHASVVSPTKSFGHLLETFVHVMAYKASKMVDVRIESVTQLLAWLDTLKVQYGNATEQLEQLETAIAAAQGRRTAAEASLSPMQAQLSASMGLNERLAEKLRSLQEAFGADKHAIEAIERQLRAERKVLHSLQLPALTLADRHKLADEWRLVPACRHLLAAVCHAYGIDDHSVEAVCRLVENPNARTELLAMTLSDETPPLGLTAADVSTLHTLHPALAVLGRVLLYQRDAAIAHAQVTRLSSANGRRTGEIDQVRTELKELHASMVSLEAAILCAGAGVASDTQELKQLASCMQATEAEVENLAPLQGYLDRLQALIRSKYFAQRCGTHLTSEGAALFISAMIAYLGPLDTPDRARLIQSWSLLFTSNNYVLPLELGIVQDSAVALYSSLEASICVPHMDKRLQHSLAIADWSQTCPLLLDQNGAAESYMTAFFQRMKSATPAVTYSVYSMSDVNLLPCLEVARKARKVVLLTQYSTAISDARFRQLLPFLRASRRPLLDAARGLPLLSHSGSNKLLPPTPSRRARSLSIPTSALASVLHAVLARVFAHLARRVSSEHLDVLYTLVALLESVETPAEVLRWVQFLASPAALLERAETTAVVAEHGRRASDARGPSASMGHVHRLRRLRSTVDMLDHKAPTNSSRSLQGISLPQLLPTAMPTLATSGFLSQDMYDGLVFLEAHVHALRGLSDAIRADPIPWRQTLATALQGESRVLLWPAPWASRLAPPLVSLLCIKCICPELMTLALANLKDSALQNLLPGGLVLRDTMCTPYVVLVAPNDTPLPKHVPELELNLTSRIAFQARTAAETLAAALASESSLVVQISCASDAAALLEIVQAHTLQRPLFLLVDALLLPELPRTLLYQSQLVRLPIAPMVDADAPRARSPMHESHLQHSAAEALARKMPRLHDCAVEKSEALAVGWTQFVARQYHLDEAVATLQQLCEMGVNDAADVASAIQDGVYGADMTARDSTDASVLLTDPPPPPRGLSMYLRNATYARQSQSLQQHLLHVVASPESAPPSSSLAMEIAMPTRSTKPVAGHRGVAEAALDAVFHRLKADSSAFYHLLLTFLSSATESALPYLDLHVLPPSWLGLPETTRLSPVRLHALVAQLDRRCDYLHFLGHPSAQSVDVGLTLHLHDVLSHIRLVYADALGGCVSSLRLALRACCPKDDSVGGIAQDAAQHPCGLVVDGLWLFYGTGFAKLPTARLVWERTTSESQSRQLELAFYRLWLLRHVGEAPWGDPRVFSCIQDGVDVSSSDCNALFGDDVDVALVVAYGTLLAPALPELPDVVTLQQPSRRR